MGCLNVPWKKTAMEGKRGAYSHILFYTPHIKTTKSKENPLNEGKKLNNKNQIH